MTGEEIKKCYCIPDEIFAEYERWKTGQDCSLDKKHYNDCDLELLSKIMTLHEAGLGEAQVKEYLDFAEHGTEGRQKCFAILQKQREGLLGQIHRMEQMLERLDYLRYEAEKRK